MVHTWRGPVNHFRADQAKDIFLQGRGLITPMETLMQMAPVANDHAEWLYNIEILQVPVCKKLLLNYKLVLLHSFNCYVIFVY